MVTTYTDLIPAGALHASTILSSPTNSASATLTVTAAHIIP